MFKNYNMLKKYILLFFISFTNTLAFAQDGSLDTSFGDGGKVVTNVNGNERANGLIIQPDGKIVVAGYTYSSTFGDDVICIRYNSNGTLDTSFGNNGIATFDIQIGSDDRALSIDIQSDGKLVLAGYSDNGSNKDGLLIRLNTNGTIDTTFGTEGKILTNFSFSGFTTRQDEYRTVKIHALTGNIVVGGTSYSASNNSRAIMARYNSSGELDPTFATGGKYSGMPNSQVSSSFLFSIEDLAIKANGKITAVGWSTAYLYLARLNSNGTMDTTFNTVGYNHQWGGRMYGMQLNSDDSFYFTGDIWTNPERQVYSGRIGASGGASITATTFNFGATLDAYSYAIEKDSNGKLVVAGRLYNNGNGNTAFLIGRLTANHAVDTSFGNNGFVTTTFADAVSVAYSLKIQTDGKIVVAGFSGNQIALARYNMGVLSVVDINSSANLIQIYPNPSHNSFNVKFDDNLVIENNTYEIIDMSGRVIQNGKFQTSDYYVNIENLTSGIYFLRLEEGKYNVKFIKK